MENLSTELFYRLIRRNRGYCNTVTTCIKTDEQEYYIPEEQRHCFLKYFEDLSVPKDKGYDSEYLELCNIRHDLISKLSAEDTKPLEPFQEEDIYKAITQLNTGKAADEYGIVSEQLKVSDQILVPLITCIFNKILMNKAIPEIFKTGILTPVLKKLKDATKMDNYRGITVTPVFAKLFEYVLLPKLYSYFEQSTL